MEILVVCTGNICRSPMAEVLLGDSLRRLGVAATVTSAGLVTEDRVASQHGVDAMGDRGLDLSAHRSRRINRAVVAGQDLILGMERQHIREVVVLDPDLFHKSFTLKELVRKGLATGGRTAGESLDSWLQRMHEGRSARELMGDDPSDDVADPYGQSRSDYDATAKELEDLIATLVRLGFAPATNGTR